MNTEQTTEESIITVAEQLFLEKGFKQTSTTEIAKAVGCNQALIHYYFRTKENLFNVIFEHKFRQLFKGIFEIKNFSNISFEDKIRLIMEKHFDILNKNPKIPSLILNELSRQPEQLNILKEKLHALPEQLFADLNKELQEEIRQGKIRPINLFDLIASMISLNAAMFVMMPVLENIFQWDETKKKNMIQHRRAENVDFVLHSLRP